MLCTCARCGSDELSSAHHSIEIYDFNEPTKSTRVSLCEVCLHYIGLWCDIHGAKSLHVVTDNIDSDYVDPTELLHACTTCCLKETTSLPYDAVTVVALSARHFLTPDTIASLEANEDFISHDKDTLIVYALEKMRCLWGAETIEEVLTLLVQEKIIEQGKIPNYTTH